MSFQFVNLSLAIVQFDSICESFAVDECVGLEHINDGELCWPPESASEEPYYGLLELGFGFQLGFVGLDIGVEPWEVLDFATGLLFIDVARDDF